MITIADLAIEENDYAALAYCVADPDEWIAHVVEHFGAEWAKVVLDEKIAACHAQVAQETGVDTEQARKQEDWATRAEREAAEERALQAAADALLAQQTADREQRLAEIDAIDDTNPVKAVKAMKALLKKLI